MRNTNIRWVIILGAISILSIIAMQSYWLIQRQTHEQQSFDQSTTISLLKVAEKMATLYKLTLPSGDFIKRITSNYYIVNYNNEIDPDVLEYFLLQEFGSNANYTDFEYAIYDCTSNKMVYGNHCNLIDPEKGVKTEGNLPKYNEMLPYYFGVKFPSRDENITTSSGLTFTLAMIAVITLAFFAFAILVILNQRRYSEMQRDFINNMTHEFKTPLTSIQLSSDYLSKQPVIQHDDRLSRYTELIRSQYQRLNSQVEKLLNIARLESKEFKLKSESIDMHQLLDEVLDSKAPESGIEGRVFNRIYKDTHYYITGDRNHMGNVINNLIDNAVKYSPADKPIDILTKDENGMLTVSVLDRGIGIAPVHQKHLFRKFYRVPSGNVHDIKGFGLGLHYVRKILRMLGGDIEVKSALGQGSCFSFHLPIQTE